MGAAGWDTTLQLHLLGSRSPWLGASPTMADSNVHSTCPWAPPVLLRA